MATIREWLDGSGFDWESGKIIHQGTRNEWDEDEECELYPGWSPPTGAKVITRDHAILDKQFNTGFGGPDCPRFVARDPVAIYFPGQYDGSTWLVRVWINIDRYLDFEKNETPYPGG